MPKQNQHYIPRVYLRNFTIEQDKINAYSIIGKKGYTPNIKGIASEKEFYTPELEELFGIYETHYSQFFQYVEKYRSLPNEASSEFGNFIYFLAIQRIRHRFQKDLIIQFLESDVGKMAKEFYNHQSNEDAEFKETIEMHLENINQYTSILKMRNWHLIFTNKHFITSDNPVCIERIENFNSPHGIGLTTDKTCLLYPISSKYCVAGTLNSSLPLFGKVLQTIPVSENETEAINDIIANHAHRYIYSSKEIPEKYKKREYRDPIKIN